MSFQKLSIVTITALIVAIGIALPAISSGDNAAPATQPDMRQQMEGWWADLAKGDPQAARALLNFTNTPTATVEFLKGKLKPLKIDPDRVTALLAKLGSADEKEWKPAYEELHYFDPRLAFDLESLMNATTESPARQRLVEILSDWSPGSLAGKKIELSKSKSGDFNFRDGKSSWWAEAKVSNLAAGGWNSKPQWTRAVRAIVLLEHLGTPDAAAIIKDMASGNPEAEPTKVAQEAIDNGIEMP